MPSFLITSKNMPSPPTKKMEALSKRPVYPLLHFPAFPTVHVL